MPALRVVIAKAAREEHRRPLGIRNARWPGHEELILARELSPELGTCLVPNGADLGEVSVTHIEWAGRCSVTMR